MERTLISPRCSFNLKSILEAGLIVVREESREGRQTVLNPLDEIDQNPRCHVETKKGTEQD